MTAVHDRLTRHCLCSSPASPEIKGRLGLKGLKGDKGLTGPEGLRGNPGTQGEINSFHGVLYVKGIFQVQWLN